MEANFPGNSKNVLGETKSPKAEKPDKVVEKVVSGEVLQRKKSLGRKFKELFFRGDAKVAAKYVVTDVLIPAFKNMVVDAGTEGLKRTVFGESAIRRRFEPGRPRTTYNTPIERYSRVLSRPGILPDQPPLGRRETANEIILVSREEAELVVERLADIINTYEVVTIADLHELVGLPHSYVDNKWGWTNIIGVGIRQVREGWLIDLPPVEPI